eukprot:1521061-Amphidinium_carterae.1
MVANKLQRCRQNTSAKKPAVASYASVDVSPSKDVLFEGRAQDEAGRVFVNPHMRRVGDLYYGHYVMLQRLGTIHHEILDSLAASDLEAWVRPGVSGIHVDETQTVAPGKIAKSRKGAAGCDRGVVAVSGLVVYFIIDA